MLKKLVTHNDILNQEKLNHWQYCLIYNCFKIDRSFTFQYSMPHLKERGKEYRNHYLYVL